MTAPTLPAAVEALSGYLRHRAECSRYWGLLCNCGLEAALSALRAVQAEAQGEPVACDEYGHEHGFRGCCIEMYGKPLFAAPPPPVDVAAWLEARAAKTNEAVAYSPDDYVGLQIRSKVAALREAADAYRREHGGRG